MRAVRYLKYALILCLFPFAACAQEEPLRLEIGGYAKWYAAGTYRRSKQNSPAYNRFDVMGDAQIEFSGYAALSQDYAVGLTAQLKGGTESADNDGFANEYALYADTKEGRTWDEVFLTFDSPAGRLFLGNVKNVAYQMAVTAPTISALGVEESQLTRLSGAAPLTTIPVYDDIGAKIQYISPTFSGFTIGAGYMPANNTNGHDATVLKSGGLDSSLVATLLYETQTDHGFFNVSVSGARFEQKTGKAGKSLSVGAQFAEGNHTIGASYMKALNGDLDNGADGAVHGGRTQTVSVGYVYDLGLAAAGVNYIVQTGENKSGNLRQSALQTTVRYRLGRGVDLFCELAYVNDNTAQNERDTFGSAAGFDLTF